MLVDDRGALVCVSGHPMTGLLGAPPSIASHVVSLFRYFHPGSDPLELDSRFWEIRDSIVQCELLVLRVLRFQVSFQHPHKVHVVEGTCGLVEGQQSLMVPSSMKVFALYLESAVT